MIKYCKNKNMLGFTVIEVIVVILIIFILSTISIYAFVDYKKNVSIDADTKMIVEVLREARSQTLSSKNASQYGVNFSNSKITLFVGSSYSPYDSSNKDYSFTSSGSSLVVNLNGGGSSVVFNRLTGDTNNYGTVLVSGIKNISISKTGLIESE